MPLKGFGMVLEVVEQVREPTVSEEILGKNTVHIMYLQLDMENVLRDTILNWKINKKSLHSLTSPSCTLSQ